MKTIRVALCQMKVEADKGQNLMNARTMVKRAAECQADLIILPEVFNAPYETALFEQYAEPIPGPSSIALADMARKYQVTIIGGSLIERDADGRLYNCSLAFDKEGTLLAQHRKVHLFDVDIAGQISFKESQTLSPGQNLTLFHLNGWKVALLICYDIRFPEMARLAALAGATLLVVPAAFNLTTGPLHWDLLMRSRAVDNQLYVLACSPARNDEALYQAWGHSMVVDPWGRVLAQADHREQIIIGNLEPAVLQQVREELPLLSQRRTDLYNIFTSMETGKAGKEHED